MSDFHQDLSDSAAAFLRVVWPAISNMVGGGRIYPIETVTNDLMTEMLDKYSGIDAWHLSDGRQLRGIASRVQWGNAWNTFTVRYSRDTGSKTEYEKRKTDIDSGSGWLYPHLTVQAFVDGDKKSNGDLLSVAVIKTASLIDACSKIVAKQVPDRCGGIRRTGNAVFIWVSWSYLQASGYAVKVHQKTTTARI